MTAQPGAAEAGPTPTAPALRIVCAYPDGTLPSGWFQAIRRARRSMDRAGYHATIDLLPVSAIPADAETVIATPELADALRAGLASSGVIEVAEPATFGAVFDALVERSVASGRLVRAPAPPRPIAIHRGLHPVGSRARVTD